MGGESFTHFAKGKDAATTFSSAVAQAQYDHGHSGYSGTIAEKPGFEMRNGGTAMTRAEAYKFAGEDGMENEKWGDAYAVPVKADDSEEIIGFLFYGWASS